MRKYIIDMPDREDIDMLLDKFDEYVMQLEELQSEISSCVEEYMDDSDDLFAQTGTYMEDAYHEHKLNNMLCRELNASRKEILSLRRKLSDNGVQLHHGEFIHCERLIPDLYSQEPDDPFYIQDPDERLSSLLSGQLSELIHFEESTPMTTIEREALRDYVVCGAGFDSGDVFKWTQFLEDMRFRPDNALRGERK